MTLIDPGPQLHLKVRHDPPLPGLQEYSIHKGSREKLGMSIRGGALNYADNTIDRTDDGIFISKIAPDGAIARHGKLMIGQRILEVNNESLLGSSHKEAVDALRSVEGNFTILVCDGCSEEEDLLNSAMIPSPVTPVLFKPLSTSNYSIDQMDSSFTMQQPEQVIEIENETKIEKAFTQAKAVRLETAPMILQMPSKGPTLKAPDAGPILRAPDADPILKAPDAGLTLKSLDANPTLKAPDVGLTAQLKSEPVIPNQDSLNVTSPTTPNKSNIPIRSKARTGPKPPVPAKRKSLTLQSKLMSPTETLSPEGSKSAIRSNAVPRMNSTSSPNQAPTLRSTSPSTSPVLGTPSAQNNVRPVSPNKPAVETEFIDPIKQSKQPSGLPLNTSVVS